MVKKTCPATAARMDGPEPDTCHCTLAPGHEGDHLCEHDFRFTDAERNDDDRAKRRFVKLTRCADAEALRKMQGVPIPGVKIVGEMRPHRGKT